MNICIEELIVSIFTACLLVWIYSVYQDLKKENQMRKDKDQKGSTTVVILGLAILIFFGLMILAPFTIIQPGNVGVVTNLGSLNKEVLNSGFHMVAPQVVVHKINTQIQKTDSDYQAASIDMQTVFVKAIVNYSVQADRAVELYQNVGFDYFERILQPRLSENLKSQVALYRATDILEKRALIRQEVERLTRADMERYGIKIDAISFSNITFSQEYEQAIEKKQLQQQIAEQKIYELEQKKKDAEMVIEKARGDAEAKKLEADAAAYFNDKTANSLSDKLLMSKYYDKWDGKLPQYILGSNTNMLMQMPGGK